MIRRGRIAAGAVVGVLGMAGLALGGVRAVRVDTLEELESRLTRCPTESGPCPHLVYVHSPSMPLSERGMAEITAAARALDVPLSSIAGEVLFAESPEPAAEDLRRALVESGATVHYPAVVLASDGRPLGNALVGYKRSDVYRALLGERLTALEAADPPAPALRAAAEPQERVRIVAEIELPGRPGAFFRRVPGSRHISFDVRSAVYLHHLETGERFRAPGRLDFVPSPDGVFFVTPATGRRGTEFYDRRALFELGARDQGGSLRPVFVDETLDDEYPSVGVLRRGADGRPTRYRILVSWNRGPAYRDYDVLAAADGGVEEVVPLGVKAAVCPGLDLSLPILSKDGLEMSARDERSGTTKVFRIGPDRCDEVFDTGMQTTKATFSADGRRLAFGARSEEAGARGDVRTAVYVLDRESEVVTRIPESSSASLSIPEFVGPDSLLFLVTSQASRPPTRFRLVCCVR